MKKLLLGLLISSLIPSMALAQGFTGGGGSGLPYTTGLAAALPVSCTAGSSMYYATNTLTWYFCMDGTYSAGIAKGADGSYRLVVSNNTSISPTASSMELYPEGNVWKMNNNGTEDTIAGLTSTQTLTNKTLTAPIVTLSYVDGHTDATNLTAANVSGTIITSYGRGGAATINLPAAASGYNFIAVVGTQHNSAWLIHSGDSNNIYFDIGNGTLASGKNHIQETNQPVGCQVACYTFQTGASAWSWRCQGSSSTSCTWVTD